MKHYRSSIPAEAKARVASTHNSNKRKNKVEYILKGKVVGVRWFDKEGFMHAEIPWKDGRIHGTWYNFDPDSRGSVAVTFSETYREGLAHGTAKQWSAYDGRLLGTYTMKHGTGLDLWRAEGDSRASVYLAEARYVHEGKWHGFEWWLNEDQVTVDKESHFWENLEHGIVREWNSAGRLRRGYPRYWVNGKKVSRRHYLRACTEDPNLPPFHEADNRPQRKFPAEVLEAIAGSREQRLENRD